MQQMVGKLMGYNYEVIQVSKDVQLAINVPVSFVQIITRLLDDYS